jgi:hypothetical protein
LGLRTCGSGSAVERDAMIVMPPMVGDPEKHPCSVRNYAVPEQCDAFVKPACRGDRPRQTVPIVRSDWRTCSRVRIGFSDDLDNQMPRTLGYAPRAAAGAEAALLAGERHPPLHAALLAHHPQEAVVEYAAAQLRS